MKLQKIVVGMDFSHESEVALAHAADLARYRGAALTLVHVGAVPAQPYGVPESMSTALGEYQKIVSEHLSEDREQLAALREKVSGHGLDVSQVIVDGLPDTGIVEAAEELQADLVVTGSHGRTGLKRFFLGSTAEKVVRTSHADVLVARAGGNSAGGFHRLLVAVDFSDVTDRVMQAALEVAAKEAEIDILHCWQLPPMSYSYFAPTKAASELIKPIRDSMSETTREHGDELLARYARPGTTMRFLNEEAAPTAGIQDQLEQTAYDLVVTGSHGYQGLRRFVLGSVAEITVRHSACSVLVVKHPTGEASA